MKAFLPGIAIFVGVIMFAIGSAMWTQWSRNIGAWFVIGTGLILAVGGFFFLPTS